MQLSADFLDQTKHRTLIFVSTTSTAENTTLTSSMVPTCLPIAVISIALVKIDNFASRLSVLSAEVALGSEELEGLGFAIYDGQCREKDVGGQTTPHPT
jgi:hypothetical protein